MFTRFVALIVSLGLLTAPALAQMNGQPGPAGEVVVESDSFLTPQELVSLQEKHADLVVIDVRKDDEYKDGHIPGAINLPPSKWRTPSKKPGQGPSQDIFLNKDGEVDVRKYEKMLGDAGITRTTPVVIYGSHGGKADSTIPAMILDILGHERVWFLDGVGVEEWKEAGYELTDKSSPKRRDAEYVAQLKPRVVWQLDQVLSHIGKDDVVFYDTRSTAEFVGTDAKGNQRLGRIPGATLCNYEDLMRPDDHTTISHEEAQKLLEERGITKDKTIVLYCQTATRVSLPYLMLKDLGYRDVRVYDASWHEYGNRPDTPIETEQPAAESQPQQ